MFDESTYRQLARIGKALSSPVRLRLLDVLDQGERTVEELAEGAGVPLKNTSAQLQQLRDAYLVDSRKQGTRVYYRLAGEGVSRLLGELEGFTADRLTGLRGAVTGRLGPLDGTTTGFTGWRQPSGPRRETGQDGTDARPETRWDEPGQDAAQW